MTLQSQITPSARNEDAYRDHAPTLRPVAGYDKHEALRMEDAILEAEATKPVPEGIRIQARIIEALRGGGMTAQRIGMAVKIRPQSASYYLAALHKLGAVYRDSPDWRGPPTWHVSKGWEAE